MKRSNRWHYNGGSITATANGTFRAYIRVNGATVRECHKTLGEAKAWLDAISNGAPVLSPARSRDALYALEILPDGLTLREVAEFYVAHHVGATNGQELSALVDCYLDDRARELRPATMRNYRQVLNRVREAFTSVDELTTERLRVWMDDLSPDNRNRAIRALSAFFSWGMERAYVTANPAANLRLARVKSPTRTIFTLEEARLFLRLAQENDPDLVPYVAVCMFAGVRPEECVQLTPRHFTAEFVRIPEDIAKTHQARAVLLPQNLRDILARYPIHPKGIACGYSVSHFDKRRLKPLRDAYKALGHTWVNDIMRHSYASYEYERTRDAAATAANLGHTTTATMFKHYRGLVEPTTGAQYFGISLP